MNVSTSMASSARSDDLTERERDILRHLAWGLSDVEIAERLFLSEETLRNRGLVR
jgi:DNA-binding NarL/FixJ family response regulator